MPFIDSKITVPVTEEKKEAIKSELGSRHRNCGKAGEFSDGGL